MKKDKEFFVGQKAFIEKEGKLLVLIDTNGRVDLPGGKIQEGETDFDEAFRREIREEIGFEIDIIKPILRWGMQFTKGEKAGKHGFLLGFICTQRSGEVTLSDEHQGYEWVDKETYRKFEDETAHFKALEEYFKIR